MKVLVTGASGFIGSHTVAALLKAGHSVRGLSRTLPHGERRIAGAEYIGRVNVGDATTLTPQMFAGVEAVVHLVGIIQEDRDRQTFQRIHVGGTEDLIEWAQGLGFKGRFVYMSAIGSAPDAPAEYSRTKYAAEQMVVRSGLPYTIFRPSLVLGKGGGFVAQMEQLVKRGGPFPIPAPFIPVPGSGKNRFQPIFVEDLTACIVQCLTASSTANHVYEVGGPTQPTFNEIVRAFARALHVRKPLLHMPIPVLRMVAPILEATMDKPPFTRDQLANLSRDNITSSRAITDIFGVHPLSFDQILSRIYVRALGPRAGV